MLKNLNARIVISYSLLIMLVVIFLMAFFNDLVRDVHTGIIENEIRNKVEFVELVFREQNIADPARDLEKVRREVPLLAGIIKLRITVMNAAGSVVADSEIGDSSGMDSHRYRAEIMSALETGVGQSTRYSSTLRTGMLYYAKKSGPFVIRLAKPLDEIEASVRSARRFILILGGFILAVTLVLVAFISRRITGPINETISFARQFASGDYSRRILNYRNDEIGALQKALNDLADSLVEKIDSLLLERRKLEITIDNIHDGICVIDSDKRILIANRSFASLLDIRSEMISRKYFEVVRSAGFNAKIEFILGGADTAVFEEEFMGGAVCEVFISPIKGESAIQGILIVLHDITEKKRIDRLKTELVGNLSHELKTPIAIQRGYLETMRECLDDRKLCVGFIEKSLANVERQNSIITDMLKLNRIETAQHFAKEPISIEKLIDGCVDILSHKAASRSVAIKADLSGVGAAALVQANRFLAEEVFFNIIDNAINYNREGGSVAISAADGAREISVTIADTGIGIPDRDVPRIFERFYRVDQSRSRETGGTGLGLSIVKHAAELLGWNIRVASGGEGTSFTVVIGKTFA